MVETHRQHCNAGWLLMNSPHNVSIISIFSKLMNFFFHFSLQDPDLPRLSMLMTLMCVCVFFCDDKMQLRVRILNVS
jgi:hypothetical protein